MMQNANTVHPFFKRVIDKLEKESFIDLFYEVTEDKKEDFDENLYWFQRDKWQPKVKRVLIRMELNVCEKLKKRSTLLQSYNEALGTHWTEKDLSKFIVFLEDCKDKWENDSRHFLSFSSFYKRLKGDSLTTPEYRFIIFYSIYLDDYQKGTWLSHYKHWDKENKYESLEGRNPLKKFSGNYHVYGLEEMKKVGNLKYYISNICFKGERTSYTLFKLHNNSKLWKVFFKEVKVLREGQYIRFTIDEDNIEKHTKPLREGTPYYLTGYIYLGKNPEKLEFLTAAISYCSEVKGEPDFFPTAAVVLFQKVKRMKDPARGLKDYEIKEYIEGDIQTKQKIMEFLNEEEVTRRAGILTS